EATARSNTRSDEDVLRESWTCRARPSDHIDSCTRRPMKTPDSPEVVVDPIAAAERPRRNFLTEAGALLVGGLAGLVPAAGGESSFIKPVPSAVKARQRPSGSDDDGYYQVASLDALSKSPQAFKIIADRKDAWNTFPNEAIGAVFLQRGEG